MAVMDNIYNSFWSEKFWLPEGFTWEDLKSTPEVRRPLFSDLYMVPALAVLLLIIRMVFERTIALQLCKFFGIHDEIKLVTPNAMCEKVFITITQTPDIDQIQGLCKQLDWSVTKVERWFRKRRNQAKHSIMKKATETTWRCLFYSILFIYGCVTLLPTTWFWDSNQWFKGYIREHNFTPDLKLYYLLELSFYTSLLFSQFLDTKRKDFWQMFLHHLVTIILILGSYAIAHIRVGTVIMLLHDASDVWLEAAKIANYSKTQKLCDGLFVVFAIVFFLTRWLYYPICVLYPYITDSVRIIGTYPAFYVFFGLCSLLMVLHLFWGYLIARMVYKFTVEGKVEKDTRSEGEDDSSDEDGSQISANGTTNGLVNGHSKKKK